MKTLIDSKQSLDTELMNKIISFDYSDTIRALLAKEPGFDTNQWLGEFQKFIYFRVKLNQNFHVPSHRLDRVWHAMIMDTAQYQLFNATVSPDGFIHHRSVSKQFSDQDIASSKVKLSALAISTFGQDFTWDKSRAAICWCSTD